MPAITTNYAAGLPAQYDSTKRAVSADNTDVNLAIGAWYEGVIASESKRRDSLTPLETPVDPDAASEGDKPT